MYAIHDEDLSAATGLGTDAIRRSIGFGVLKATNNGQLGRAKRRKWADETVGNASRLKALLRAGLSLPQSAALLAIGGFFWRSGVRYPEMVSRLGDESNFNKFLRLRAHEIAPKADDLLLLVVDGRYALEKRGPEATLLALLQDDGLVITKRSRINIVKDAIGESESTTKLTLDSLPIAYTDAFDEAEAMRAYAAPEVIASVNLDFCARRAIHRALLIQGFVSATVKGLA